ncbi:MAG: molybdopterin-dependent oxidoreductase [Gammaproteobacteria bacterium]|nr:molybdopterin-dependent oxidoreductase [Gammaproteobacteria bacterium]
MDPKDTSQTDPQLTRRRFLVAGGALSGVAAAKALGAQQSEAAFSGVALAPAERIENPLEYYPDRNWEEVYRDQYRYDRSFTFICAPNDTHMCRVRASERNGVVVRLEQNYDHQRYGDLYGNTATPAWNPRMCLKGYTVHRRVYGPYRAKGPMIRAGWREWADAGFPSLSDQPELRNKYRFDARGTDTFVRVTWDEATTYVAKAMVAIAQTYSGAVGRRRLIEKDGYPEEMLEHWEEAGTRTMKLGSSLPLHGVIGKFGIFRMANLLGLLDANVRKVGPEKARGAREWSEYTWRGDQAPGQPFVHGLQTSDIDLNDLRFTKFTVQVGKNLIENKMPEAHWLTEIMERGGHIAVIAPEYNPSASKADYWISVRPGLSDTAIFLYVAKRLMDENWYDDDFVKRFTDFPLLVRADTLKRLRPEEIIPGYRLKDISDGPSFTIQGITAEQRQRVGDFLVFDERAREVRPLSRDDVGERMPKLSIEPALAWKGMLRLVDGSEVEAMTVWSMYREHLKDYDLDTVAEICGAPKELIDQLARDFGRRFWDPDFIGKSRETYPIAIHYGEGINHYFHATLHNRAVMLPLLLVGSIGIPGSGAHTWAGNYKGALFQGSLWSGPGVGGSYVREDPFNQLLDENAKVTPAHVRELLHGEEMSYWGFGDRPLIVDTPGAGRKMFTGRTHLPSPTKLIWYNNANLINQAKWVYHLLVNVNPKIDLIIDQQVEWTGSAEYSDVVLPANTWLEFQTLECGGSCSNPFLQIWGGNGIKPLYDSKDDGMIFALVSEKLSDLTGDRRFRDHWKFMLEGRPEVYIQRVLDNCTTTQGYKVADIMAGKYGEPGAALMLFRTYPRVSFYEQVHDSIPFYTDTGRLNAYTDIPEAIEYGENLVVHREAPEATPYLPNVIVSSSPYIRPRNYGITPEMLQAETMHADLRAVANNKMPWKKVKETNNPLWKVGYTFYCMTPKSRHTTHSSWATVDWNWIWSTNFGDPYRMDKRQPGVGDWQVHMNPQAAQDLGIADGDYIYVDANPSDRPYVGAKPEDARYKAFRLLTRVKFNPAYPYNVVMTKHSAWIATERTVKAHETRPDGRALAEDTGYQSNFRYGSHQSITRGWAPPMHQTDSLFHKKVGTMGFVFGFDVDNHAVNTVPKETLVRIEKGEPGGIGAKGPWAPATSGFTPGTEDEFMRRYLAGDVTNVGGKT